MPARLVSDTERAWEWQPLGPRQTKCEGIDLFDKTSSQVSHAGPSALPTGTFRSPGSDVISILIITTGQTFPTCLEGAKNAGKSKTQ